MNPRPRLIAFQTLKTNCDYRNGACDHESNVKYAAFHRGACNAANCPIWRNLKIVPGLQKETT